MTEDTKLIRAYAGHALDHFHKGVTQGSAEDFRRALGYLTALKVKVEEMEASS